jgi:hypothetical protein
MKKNVKLIGIGSIARVGKDFLADMLIEEFSKRGLVAKKYALANALKKFCELFLKEKLGIDVWTNDSQQKSQFRDFLVWYGKQKREITNGTHWTKITEKEIINDATDVLFDTGKDLYAIVTDVRYFDPRFSNDEVCWVKESMGGILINLMRVDNDGNLINPANDEEKANMGRVAEVADFELLWETVDGDKEKEINLGKKYVSPLCDEIEAFFKVKK